MMKAKKLLTGILAVVFTITPVNAVMGNEGIPIDEAHFPDAIFRTYVSENCDTDKNGSLSDKEITHVTYIDVVETGVSNLKGVEYFTAITRLVCYDNQLTILDVSKNTALKTLWCNNNQLTTLDLSKNTALEDLCCDINKLTALDLSNNTNLKTLYCGDNQLTVLDVSGCMALKGLSCYNNQLTTLSLGGNAMLVGLDCESNQLTMLDLSNNTALETLRCSDNQLKRLDLGNVVSDLSLKGNGGKKGKGLTITVESKNDQKQVKGQLKKAGVPKAKVKVRK